MRCTRCGRPAAETTTLSSHITSEGWVRYRRCVCGAVVVERTPPVTTDGTRTR